MEINLTKTYIGTSGYSFDDWQSFYPEGLDKKDLIRYFSDSGLNFLELSFTLYKTPLAERMEELLESSQGKLKFSVKITKNLMRPAVSKEAVDDFLEGIAPLAKSGNLVALLADYHHSYVSSVNNFNSILNLQEKLGTDIPIFLHLENKTWYKERQLEMIRNKGFGLTIVDMPKGSAFPPHYQQTFKNSIYYRLFGRSSKWVALGSKALEYSYSDEELNSFISYAYSYSPLCNNIIFSFCNPVNGMAVANALRTKELAKSYKN